MDKCILVPFSACLAETITYPIDYFKTMIQVNKKDTIKQIIKNNYKNTYNGLRPALLRHCVYTTSRINIYEHLKTSTNNLNDSFLYKFCIGGFSGALSQLVSTPFDLLKVRYITNTNMNKKSIYANFKNIIQQNGILGIYKGTFPNVCRGTLVNFGEIATYDVSKQYLMNHLLFKDDYKLHISSSIISGFVSSLLCTPADVVKSRIMMYNSEYSSISNCIYKITTTEGISTFYKGFFPIWFRLAPWQLTFWVSYEKTRQIFNIESF